MIEADKRKAVFLLHQEGMPLREIARRLHLSRNTVGVIIAQGGQLPKLVRSAKQKIDTQLLERLYEQCGGWIQRMHEKLFQEEGIEVKYSTLTRMLRQLGISKSKSQQSRCGQVPDEPGAEMQHDTTLYTLKLGQQPQKVVATVLYLRYSKRRYLKFYRCFNRFQMKCFLHEALTCWGYYPEHGFILSSERWRQRTCGQVRRRAPHKNGSQGLQERQEVGLRPPSLGARWLDAGRLPERLHGVALHLQVGRDVSTCCGHAGVAKVVADHRHVGPRLQQRDCAAMPQDMWRDALVPQRGVGTSRRCRMFDQHVCNAVARQRPSLPVDEHALPIGTA
jgi:transposase